MDGAIQIPPDGQPWREFPDAPGVRYRTLRRHEGGGLTLLLQFAPGAAYHAHRHPGGEEYWVLDGVLDDLGRAWPAGSYIWHPPGSAHRPRSEAGCTVLVILPQAVQLLGSP